MEDIEFWKMTGSGNDFILIDNMDGRIREESLSRIVQRTCRRRESVGADGVIFIIDSDRYDFRWRFFNADGGEVEMCGNGGRCVCRFAFLKGICGAEMTFDTLAGPVSGKVSGRVVKILMPRPTGLSMDVELDKMQGWLSSDFINTGVPHVVVMVEDLPAHPVIEQGRAVRYHERFSPKGTNADFIRVTGPDQLEIRTYERGVEDETLACGTGAIASALVASTRGLVKSPVKVKTLSKEILNVYFQAAEDSFDQVWLEGQTSIIYKGRFGEEAL